MPSKHVDVWKLDYEENSYYMVAPRTASDEAPYELRLPDAEEEDIRLVYREYEHVATVEMPKVMGRKKIGGWVDTHPDALAEVMDIEQYTSRLSKISEIADGETLWEQRVPFPDEQPENPLGANA